MSPSKFSLRSGRRLNAIFCAGALLLLLMGGLAFVSLQVFNRLAVANAWNLHTYQVLIPVAALDTALDQEESRLRGYSLTGDTNLSDEARDAHEHIVSLIGEVKQLTRDRHEQQQRIVTFERDYQKWNRTYVVPLLEIADSGTSSETSGIRRATSDTVARHQAVEKLQVQLDEMQNVERQLLVSRRQDQDQTQQRMVLLLILGSGSGLLILGGLFGLLWRGVKTQEVVSSELRAANTRLLREFEARVEAQERLRESEESYRHLAEDSLDLICAYGSDGKFSYVSPASLPLLGFLPVELVGLEPRRLFHSDDFPRHLTLQEWLNEGKNSTHTARARRKDGSWVWLEIVGHAIVHPESGQVTQFHTTARDISVRVREERRRQEMLEGLHATVRVADRLIEARSQDDLLRVAAQLAHSELGYNGCQVWLADEQGRNLRGAFAVTERGAIDPIAHLNLPVPTELQNRNAASGERWNAVELQTLANAPGSGVVPLTTAFPLVVGERLLGVIFVGAEASGGTGSVRGELGRVFASLLSTLLERVRSEDRSRQAQKLLETVVDNAPLILYAVDASERFVFSVGRALDTLGFTSHTMVGRTVGEITGEDSPTTHAVRAVLRGEIVDGPAHMNGQDFDAFRRPLRDENGRITGMVGVLVNVTDRARAQYALAESEARYRNVVNSVTEVIFQTDKDANWTFLNAAWHEIMGYTVEESLGRNADDFVHPDDLEAVHAHSRTVALDVGNGVGSRMTARYRTRDGEVRWMEVFVRPLLTQAGEFAGFAGTLADITERFLAERALRQTTEMQRAILGSASYAIFSCDARGVIQTFNRAAEEMLLLPASSVCGLVRAPLLIASEDLRARSEELGRELNREVVPWEALTLPALQKGREEREWMGIRSNGTRFPMKLSISPLRGEDGEVAGFVAIGYDLSESRRIEKLKSEFVSVVSHELRTPLTSIRGALGLLGGGVAGALPERARQMIDIAHKNAERLVLLINDILDIEKIENGQMKFEMAPLEMAQVVTGALQSNAPYAQALNVTLVDDSPEEELRIEGDEARLSQVMANLLSNAAKFTPQGGEVVVRTRRISAGDARACGAKLEGFADTDWVRVDVFDGGEGVPTEFEDRLFERFAQADSSATRAKGGTGLGLAISRAIVEKMHGVLRYTPANAITGEPHSFNFLLPLIPVKRQGVALPEANRERLLVCEDDPDIAAFLEAVLKSQGFEVTIAETLAGAMEALERESFDAMTLDLMLSDGDGISFLGELRAKGFDLPVVVVSAFSEEGRVRGGALDVLDWLHKPIDSDRLAAALARCKHEGARARILHVEDDADIRQVTRAVLGSKVEVREAATLEEAKELLSRERFDLALVDIGLPDGDGLELVPLLAQMTPPVPVALFSAQEAEGVAGRQVAAALVKSRSNNATLRSTIERLLSMEPDSLASK